MCHKSAVLSVFIKRLDNCLSHSDCFVKQQCFHCNTGQIEEAVTSVHIICVLWFQLLYEMHAINMGNTSMKKGF